MSSGAGGSRASREPGALRFRKLTATARALTYVTREEEILALAAERAADLFGTRAAAVAIASGAARVLVQVYREGALEPPELVEARLDERIERRLEALLGPSSSAPLVARGAVVGLLTVAAERLPAQAEWFLAALADQLAVAVDHLVVEAEARRALAAVAPELPAPSEAAPEIHPPGAEGVSQVVHDLRSPVHSILLNAELLATEALGPLSDAQRKALRRLRTSADYLASLADDLLALRRLPDDTAALAIAPVPLRPVVDRCLEVVSPAAEDRGGRLLVEDELPAGLAVLADAGALSRVLINLLTNAIRYTPPGGAVRVRLGTSSPAGAPPAPGDRPAAEARAFVAVHDSGPGIEPARLETLLRPGRLQRDPASFSGGAGLGLTIVQELLTAMGGCIEAESEVGRGSAFAVELPIAG